MLRKPVYLDNHATTQVDPRVLEAMLPYFSEVFGNPGSINHQFGHDARDAVAAARKQIATSLRVDDEEIIFTSGATESNNLALKGFLNHPLCKIKRVISVATEHHAILEPLQRIKNSGVEVHLLAVRNFADRNAGQIDLSQLESALSVGPALVSIMFANNEIGTLQPIQEISALCRKYDSFLHTDATQAVGRVALDLKSLGVDMLSFSGHKLYGPKGIGGLYVRQGTPRVRLSPLLDGGGQESGLRGGTLNVPAIVGLGKAVELAVAEMSSEMPRLRTLRDLLFKKLQTRIEGVELNGPALDEASLRLANNLNCRFSGVDGGSLMLSVHDVACSSGAACSSANPEPSHVLKALGLPDHEVRASLRFGLGRFNTEPEIDVAVESVAAAVSKLRNLT